MSLFTSSQVPYLFGIGANLCFGTASIVFSRFTKSHSPRWMNQLKVFVAFFCFCLAFFLTESFCALPLKGVLYLGLSGFLGLFLGDLFLFHAFSKLGAARTLVLYSCQPFLLGIYGFLALGQTLSGTQATAIVCMILCVLTFVHERKRKTGSIDIVYFLYAFLGIFFDAIGVMFSREAFDMDAGLGSFQANAMRALGGMIGFFFLSPKSYQGLIQDLSRLRSQDRNLALGASFLGTFVSLSLYLQALKSAHVATLTAISITSPLWVSIIDHVRERVLPNHHLVLAFVLFVTGFFLLQMN